MTLQDYLNQKHMTETAFAELVGIKPSGVNRLMPVDGRPPLRKPGWELMARIAAVTGGAVMPNDFMEDLPELIEGFDLPSGENDPPTSALGLPACIRRAS